MNKKVLTALSILATGALALTGCTTSGNGAPGNSSSETLVYGQSEGITQLDPNIVGLETDGPPAILIFDGLTSLSEDGEKAVSDLATSWESSADGRSWTFTLRKGVKFHDGTALTAKHVVGSVEYVLNPKTASQWRAKISTVTSIAAPDGTTVKLTLSAPNPELPVALSYVRIVDMDQIATINTAPNGTGPYKFKSFTPKQELVLTANDDYFGGKPAVATIKFVKYADQTAAGRALASGALTAFYGLPKTNLKSLLENESLQLIDSPAPGGLAVWELDTTSVPFNNVKARQALAYAMDRQSIASAGYSGYAAQNDLNTHVSPKSPYYNSNLPSYGFNLDKAKQLFTEAGVTAGTTLTFGTTGAFPEWTIAGELLQADLAKIGITLKIETNEISTWVQSFYPAGKSYPGMIVPNQLSFAPVPDTFSSRWFGASGTCECNWKGTDAYNAALSIATQSSSEADRKAAFHTLQEEINANVPIIIIGSVGNSVVAQKTLFGVWMQGDNLVHLEKAVIK